MLSVIQAGLLCYLTQPVCCSHLYGNTEHHLLQASTCTPGQWCRKQKKVGRFFFLREVRFSHLTLCSDICSQICSEKCVCVGGGGQTILPPSAVTHTHTLSKGRHPRPLFWHHCMVFCAGTTNGYFLYVQTIYSIIQYTVSSNIQYHPIYSIIQYSVFWHNIVSVSLRLNNSIARITFVLNKITKTIWRSSV